MYNEYKEDRGCSTHGGKREMNVEFWWGIQNERDN
jgi:hypothetical protein